MRVNSIGLLLFLSLFSNLVNAQNICYPTFTSIPENTTTDCLESNPIFGMAEAASACCEGNTTVTSADVHTGGAINNCSVNTAFGPGPDWAFWLPGVNTNSVVWLFDSQGSMIEYEDDKAMITGHIYSAANPAQGFDVFIILNNKRNWEEWSALGRGYKNDLNLAGSQHTDWSYYEMQDGFCYLQGTGELEGSHLQLTPKPSNYYFGFQVGNAANNKNSNYGISGWFFYDGFLNGNPISGHGDINADLACQAVNDDCGSDEYTRFFRASNTCELSSYASQIWSSLDTTAPVFDEFLAAVTTTCEELSSINVTASDNCSSVTIDYSDNVVESGCNGLIERTYTATDGCGNSTTAVMTIDLQSNEPLAFINFPQDIQIECSLYTPGINPNLTYTAGCGNITLTSEDSVIEGDCPNNFTVVRLYTITDACGISVSQAWTINVDDTTAPNIFNVPEDITISCGDPISVPEVFATDNCSGLANVSLSAQTIDGECGYTFIRTWIATDLCGNTSEASQVITVLDNTPPFFTNIPQGGSISCGTDLTEVEMASADDACSEVVVTYVDNLISTSCSDLIQRTFTATDACGNFTTAMIEIVISDNEAPVFEDLPIEISLECGEIVSLQPLVTDNCSDFAVTFIDSPITSCAGSFVRTFTASDACGNIVEASVAINFIDNTPPQLSSAPSDVQLSCGDAEPEVIAPTFTDNCSAVSVGRIEDLIIDGACDGNYQIVRRWLALDDCGNIAEFSQNIFFTDTQGPEFNEIETTLEIECGNPIPNTIVIAEDFCSGFVENIEFSEVELELSCGSQIVRTWTASDACGNMSSISQTINIIDTQGPIFNSYPEDVTISCDDPIPAAAQLTGIDICSGEVDVFVTEFFSPGTCEGSTVLTRIFRSFDECGNSGIYAQTITITDTEAPVFVNPLSSIEVTCNNVQQPAIFVEDNCSEFDLFFEDITIVPGCGGIIERTYTATDACGNSSQFVQMVTLVDNIPPVLQNTPEATLTLECGAPIPDVFLFAQDNCSGITPIGLQANTVEDGCNTIFTRTWISVDGCGNSSEFTQTITIIDTTAPTFSETPADIIIACDGNLPPVPQIIATDACTGNVPVSFQEETIGVSLCPQIVRTWCASDCSGNEVCHSQTITLSDDNGSGFAEPVFRVVNTASTVLSVSWIAPQSQQVDISIYNLAGQKILPMFEGTIYGGITYSIPFDTSVLSTGIYLVRANSENYSFTEKIIIR
jgi:hypothetical protein